MHLIHFDCIRLDIAFILYWHIVLKIIIYVLWLKVYVRVVFELNVLVLFFHFVLFLLVLSIYLLLLTKSEISQIYIFARSMKRKRLERKSNIRQKSNKTRTANDRDARNRGMWKQWWNSLHDIEFIDSRHTKYVIAFLSVTMTSCCFITHIYALATTFSKIKQRILIRRRKREKAKNQTHSKHKGRLAVIQHGKTYPLFKWQLRIDMYKISQPNSSSSLQNTNKNKLISRRSWVKRINSVRCINGAIRHWFRGIYVYFERWIVSICVALKAKLLFVLILYAARIEMRNSALHFRCTHLKKCHYSKNRQYNLCVDRNH